VPYVVMVVQDYVSECWTVDRSLKSAATHGEYYMHREARRNQTGRRRVPTVGGRFCFARLRAVVASILGDLRLEN
jgi:hypothetical protein